jgi:hypothetical protein
MPQLSHIRNDSVVAQSHQSFFFRDMRHYIYRIRYVSKLLHINLSDINQFSQRFNLDTCIHYSLVSKNFIGVTSLLTLELI